MFEIYDEVRQRLLAPHQKIRRPMTIEAAARIAERFRRGFIACHGEGVEILISIRRAGGAPLVGEEQAKAERIMEAFRTGRIKF